jgi:phosphoenolpyruvate carboxykinase (ATP)
VKAIAENTITWTDDEDFGYRVAESVPGIDDPELLRPRSLYERESREDEYRALVERFRTERLEFLKGFPDLDEEIIKAVG